jgi:hypothetical protein
VTTATTEDITVKGPNLVGSGVQWQVPGAGKSIIVRDGARQTPKSLDFPSDADMQFGVGSPANFQDFFFSQLTFTDASTHLTTTRNAILPFAVAGIERKVRNLTAQSIALVHGHVAPWAQSRVYAIGDVVSSANPRLAGRYFKCTTGGTSGALVEPQFNRTVGNTATDGSGIVWLTVSVNSYSLTWRASTHVALGTIWAPKTANGLSYLCAAAGTTGSSEPAWNTTTAPPGSTTDGGVTWTTVPGVLLPTLKSVPIAADGTGYVQQAAAA